MDMGMDIRTTLFADVLGARPSLGSESGSIEPVVGRPNSGLARSSRMSFVHQAENGPKGEGPPSAVIRWGYLPGDRTSSLLDRVKPSSD
jgi:hypothetical protein